jgi:hypothetical protein
MPCLRHRPATVATAAFGGGVPMIVDLGDASYPPRCGLETSGSKRKNKGPRHSQSAARA